MIDTATRKAFDTTAIETTGQINLELSTNEKLTATLQEEVGALASRINGFLRPTGPSSSGESGRAGGARDVPVRSDVASRLASNNAGIQNAIMHLRELHARFDA